MLCWGFSDSQIQAFVYWLIRVTYGSGPEQARAVGFFKVGERGGGRGSRVRGSEGRARAVRCPRAFR